MCVADFNNDNLINVQDIILLVDRIFSLLIKQFFYTLSLLVFFILAQLIQVFMFMI